MSASKKRRLVMVALGTVATIILYMGIYFTCVSVECRYAMDVPRSVGSPYAYYHVGPVSLDFAHVFFEPARLFDASYLRPHLWEDRYL